MRGRGRSLWTLMVVSTLVAFAPSTVEAQPPTGDPIEAKLDVAEMKLDSLELKLDDLGGQLPALEAKLDAIEAKLDNLGGQLPAIEAKLDAIEAKLDTPMAGTLGAGSFVLLAVVLLLVGQLALRRFNPAT